MNADTAYEEWRQLTKETCSLCRVPFKANITKAEIWCSKCDRFTRTVGVTGDTGTKNGGPDA